jgi:hypothetical protein
MRMGREGAEEIRVKKKKVDQIQKCSLPGSVPGTMPKWEKLTVKVLVKEKRATANRSG